MAKKHKESYFWTSYSDLMTNLFFVMLMLFVLAIALLHRENVKIGKERDATKAELEKIEEIRDAIKHIDPQYFEYDDKYETLVLKTQVKFQTGSSNINDLSQATKDTLRNVCTSIRKSIKDLMAKDSKASFLLVIEGQASRDKYSQNNQLSYERALSLFRFWFPNQSEPNLRFYNLPCEVVIAGAGYMEGKPRSDVNSENQRFLIKIMPKAGKID